MNLSPPAKVIPNELWQKIENYQKNSVQGMIAHIQTSDAAQLNNQVIQNIENEVAKLVNDEYIF